MLTLVSVDVIAVGQRPVFIFRGIPGFDPRTLRGQSVMIDGHRYDVLGVETYAVMEPVGMSFGLAVKRTSQTAPAI